MASDHVFQAMEPMAGAGLAIGLAYLALDRFRYVEHVARDAEKILNTTGEKYARIGDFKTLSEVRLLRRINAHARARARRSVRAPTKDEPAPPDDRAHRYSCEVTYERWFGSQVDRILTSILTVYSGLLLCAGVWGSQWTNLNDLYDDNQAAWLKWILVVFSTAAMAVPALFALRGNYLRDKLWGLIDVIHPQIMELLGTFGPAPSPVPHGPHQQNPPAATSGSDPTYPVPAVVAPVHVPATLPQEASNEPALGGLRPVPDGTIK